MRQATGGGSRNRLSRGADHLARVLAAERRARAASQSLQAITAALSKALTPADVADVVIRQGLPGIGADAGAVALLDEQHATLEMLRSVGYPAEMVDAFRTTSLSASTPMAEAARSQQPVWREAADAAQSRFPDYARVNHRFGAGAALPLVADGRVLGALALSFTASRTFDESDRAFATALAAQCAFALERARLYDAERRARAAAEASAAQLDIILRGVADGIVAQDRSGRLIYANDAAARMIGYPSVQALTAAPPAERLAGFEICDADDQPLPPSSLPMRRALLGEPSQSVRLRFRVRASGEERWALVSATPVHDEHGQVSFAISIFRDITEQQHAEQRLAFLAEASTVLGSSLDYELTLARLAELAVPRLADACVIDLLQPDNSIRRLPIVFAPPVPSDLAQAFESIGPPNLAGAGAAARVLRTGEPLILPMMTDDALVATARDHHHLALLRAADIRSSLLVPLVARGSVLGALTLVTTGRSGRTYSQADLTLAEELARRAAQAMDNARLYQEAQAAVHARDEFLSIASHELRTPVAAIKGLAQLLQRSQRRGMLDADRLERSLSQLAATSDRLAALTDDLLDVSRLQTGRVELHQEPVDLGVAVAECVDSMQAGLDERHTLTLVVWGTCPVRIDRVRFEQVVANLIENAVKYSPSGGPITVEVGRSASGAEVSVADQGIGLPPDQVGAIFQPFGRASNASERQIQGMGLGLYICRRIVERHGGRIWAESAGENQGTTVRVWLPCAAAS